jgi:hypothetical protein
LHINFGLLVKDNTSRPAKTAKDVQAPQRPIG